MFDDLKTHLLGLTSVVAGAIALISGLHAKLEDAIAADAGTGDQDAVNALLTQMDAAKNDLAAAITANTPTDPSATGVGVVMPTPPQAEGTQPWIDPNAPTPVGSSDVVTPPVDAASPATNDGSVVPPLSDGTPSTDAPAPPVTPVPLENTPAPGATSGAPTT